MDPTDEAFWETLVQDHNHRLTVVEWETIEQLVRGLTVKEIADDLYKGETTVREAIARAGDRMFGKQGVVPTPALLGAWFAIHRTCCLPDELR